MVGKGAIARSSKMLAWLTRETLLTEMVTVYSKGKDQHDYGIHCALISNAKTEDNLKRHGI
jgi:hypothetical protein